MNEERNLPGVNQAVYVTYQNQEYRTFVLERRPPEFWLAYPFPYDVRPEEGDELSVGFVSGSEYGRFPAVVVARSARPVPILHVRQTAPPTFTWRRGAYRLPVRLGVIFARKDGQKGEGLTLDLSATGARFSLRRGMPLAVGEEIAVTIDLGEGTSFEGRARVVRIDEAGEEVQVAVHFLPERVADTDRLARWIFARQRELRRKGLL